MMHMCATICRLTQPRNKIMFVQTHSIGPERELDHPDRQENIFALSLK